MQFSTIFAAAAAVASASVAYAAPSQLQSRTTTGSQTIRYDNRYDAGSTSMLTVSCSDGANGLASKWPSFSVVPHFAEGKGGYGVVASPDVGGWNSPSCGTCYNINYNGRNAWVVAVDHSAGGFNIGQNVMDYLTNGRAVEFGKITATVTPLDCSKAGWQK